MYLDKFIKYTKTVNERTDIPQNEKDNLIRGMKRAFVTVTNISNDIIDAKIGTSEYNSRKEYNEAISAAFEAMNKINEMYEKQFGECVFETIPTRTSELYDLSRIINRELLENIKNENQYA